MRSVALTLLLFIFVCAFDSTAAFIQTSRLPFLQTSSVSHNDRKRNDNALRRPSTNLFYKNETQEAQEQLKMSSFLSLQSPPDEQKSTKRRRNEIKKELARAAITNYDAKGKPSYAEDLMKELETIRPWEGTAYHPELNARWSFVFTGVPTIGMKLITLLSRISVGFPVVDFRDVFLEVSNADHVRAVVSWKMFGIPMELNVHTGLEPDLDDPYGNVMLETFQKLTLMGVPLPTPESWARTRTLDISYLDEDMMVARTAGGEPHLLLRISRCMTADEECDVDEELTGFFDEARELYGDRIARCLVDRDFGEDAAAEACVPSDDGECDECSEHDRRDPLANLMSFDPKTLFAPGGGPKGDDLNLKP